MYYIITMFATHFLVLFSIVLAAMAFQKFPAKIVPSTGSVRVLKMNLWGIQKLGQSVIDIMAPAPTGSDSASIFKRTTTGSGTDDRHTFTSEDEEHDWQTLSKIDKSFQQKALLTALESDFLGTATKMERIQSAAAVENLLPSSFSAHGTKSSNLRAGGLMDEWEM